MRIHRGWRVLLPVLVALVGTGGALAAAHSTATVKAAHNNTLNTSILVDQSGRTLYHLTTEKGTKFTCTGACATIWPPLTVAKGAKPTAGPGISKSKLGTIKRPDGRIQVTYAGLTLYRYTGDSKPGDAKGEGFMKIWYAISPTGGLVKGATNTNSGGYGS